MKYVNYDSDTGEILGWYDSIVNADGIPDTAVEISDTLWLDAINNNYNYYDVDTSTCSLVDFSTDEEVATALVAAAQTSMVTELEWCDLMLKYIASSDTARSEGLTADQIYAYAIECRDYVQYVDGVLTIVGDKPARPE